MKSLSLTLLALFMIAANVVSAQDSRTQVLNATQVAKLDLTGKWSGKRNQYSWDKKSFIESFQYEFDLKQEGDIVTGTSTIISSNGDYADMKLEGVIVGNKFHFREYEVVNAIRPTGKLWCFKSGELNIVKDGDNIKLSGSTSSFMEGYNYPCSGGETDITKVDNSNNNLAVVMAGTAADTKVEASMNITTYPNPFIENANINYNLTGDSKVKMEVFDISGKLVANLFEGNQKAGVYNYTFSGKNYSSQSGMYIIKMTVNGDVYSHQIVQMR
ncbi:MAG: hypothetical protein JWO06_434 [Bacteroidota bacterium]|nr:hypothetical protein [Bacteroidota bacterium]